MHAHFLLQSQYETGASLLRGRIKLSSCINHYSLDEYTVVPKSIELVNESGCNPMDGAYRADNFPLNR